MQVLLNIGLDNVPTDLSYTNGVLNPLRVRQILEVVQALRAAGFTAFKSKRVESDTEPTLVVNAMFTGHMVDFEASVGALSRALNQDCIAVYNERTGQGQLIGPRAAEWGPFNPEFFFLLDGTRLQEPVAKAA